MQRKSTLLATLLLRLILIIEPPHAEAQAPASDTTGRVASDSQAAARDTSRGARDSVNSGGAARDTPGGSDTTGARDAIGGKDTTRRRDTTAAGDSTRRDTTSRKSAEPRQPADSILAAACTGGSSVARDLLVVVFAPDAGSKERAAAAKRVNGKLLGPVSSSEPGAYYFRVLAGGEFPSHN